MRGELARNGFCRNNDSVYFRKAGLPVEQRCNPVAFGAVKENRVKLQCRLRPPVQHGQQLTSNTLEARYVP